MRQAQDVLIVQTEHHGHHALAATLNDWLARRGVSVGVVTLLVQHTHASLTVREIADRDDLQTFFDRVEGAPEEIARGVARYATELSIPVSNGKLALGARQGVFLYEERDIPQTRHIVVHLIGE